MKNTLILLLIFAATGLMLNILPWHELLPDTQVVITEVDYSSKTSDQLLKISGDFEAAATGSFDNPVATKNEEWQERVLHYGFDPDKVAYQEALNAAAESEIPSLSEPELFPQAFTLSHDPETGERNPMTTENLQQLIRNIDRQIESIKQLKIYVLQQISSDGLPVEKFEQDSEKELARLQSLKQTVMSASGIVEE